MADKSSIEWTDATWNPTVGCEIVSPGCKRCYAMRMARRCEAMGIAHYAGTTKVVNGNAVWTGQINAAPDHILTQPLRWKRPRRIFVNSMSDLFAEGVPDEVIDRVFAVMALCPQHTFQVLTKRPERMRDYVASRCGWVARGCLDLLLAGHVKTVGDDWPVTSIGDIDMPDDVTIKAWPLPNVWLGVSVEDQTRAYERISILLDTPAAKRFISAEPLLGPVDLAAVRRWVPCNIPEYGGPGHELVSCLRGNDRLDWVIVGGESGPSARPMHPDWARQIRDDCAAAGVPFFFKQNGECIPAGDNLAEDRPEFLRLRTGFRAHVFDDMTQVVRVGKRAAGRLLDGVEHNGMPG